MARFGLVAGTLVVVAAAVAVALVVADREDTPTTPRTPPAAGPLSGPVLAVKVDNLPAARPQTGIGSAAVVYVEPVEGGLTRLVAIFTGTPPPVVGPVRSARRTDIELLAQYGKPVLAYSGAAPELLPALHAANVVNASPEEDARAYHRDRDRPAPHNLYVRTADLPGGAQAPREPPLRFGPAPGGGTTTATHEAAGFTFTWSAPAGRWLVSTDGTPFTATGTGRLGAATVVSQRVRVSTTEPGEDARGGSPVAHTVGTGEAVVLRDGRRFTGTWSRPDADAPTTFRTADGQDLPLATGPVWVVLLPA